jgi:uncharacterized protein YcbK (DUF882 family)
MGDLSKDFSRHEFACKDGCGFDTVDAELIDVLQRLRDHFCRRVTINSGCRCDKRNKAVGGAENSQHKLGRAADIVVDGFPPESVQHYLEGQYPGVYGIGRYNTFTHIDTRSNGPARWG